MTSTSDKPKKKELKENNIRIFRLIGNYLASDDEDNFLDGARKITRFISVKEAYYAQALPIVS